MSSFNYSIALGSSINGPTGSNVGVDVRLSSDGRTLAVLTLNKENTGVSTELIFKPYVCVYTINTTVLPNTWNKIGEIIGNVNVTSASSNDVFCSLALSDDGSTVALGEASAGINNTGTNTDTGLVRVFKYNGSNWIQQGTELQGTINYGYYGYSVDLNQDGSILAVGSRTGSGNGNVFVYSYNGSWVTKGQQLNGSSNHFFGSNVKLSSNGNSLLVAATTLYNNNNAVSVFSWNTATGQWGQRGATISNTVSGPISLWFSEDGEKFAVGYPQANSNAGSVSMYAFQSGTNTINQLGTSSNGSTSGINYGTSLVMNQEANMIVIGSPNTTVTQPSSIITTSTGGINTLTYMSSTNSWIVSTYIAQNGTSTNQRFALGMASNANLSVLALIDSNGVVYAYQAVNIVMNFNPSSNPIYTTTNTTVPSDSFLTSAVYGAFGQYTVPRSYIEITGMPSSFQNVGVYTVTYKVINNDIIPLVPSTTVLSTDTRTISVTPYIAPICFYAGANVLTDQGEVEIQDIIPHHHSIDGMLVCDVTKVLNSEESMVYIRKDTMATGVPYCDTFITNKHKVLYDGRLVQARELVEMIGDQNKVSVERYSGSPVYNVVLMKPYTMVVNGMTCETLHPRNVVYVRIKIREEMATCKDPKRLTELIEQDNMIVEALSRKLVKNE